MFPVLRKHKVKRARERSRWMRSGRKDWYKWQMAVFQCPVCELRFLLDAEVRDHLRTDHPDFDQDPAGAEGEARAGRLRQTPKPPRDSTKE